MKSFQLLLLVAVVAASSAAKGEVIVSYPTVNNSSALTGYVTQDIQAQTGTSKWLNAELLLTLTKGSIYQNSYGSDTSPNPAWFTLVPALEFDTFVTAGHINYSQTPSFIGGAVDLGGAAAKQFDAQKINATWYTSETNSGLLTLARITLSNDAEGSFGFITNASEGNKYSLNSGVIHSGRLSAVPEPSSFALLLMGLAASAPWLSLRSRRR